MLDSTTFRAIMLAHYGFSGRYIQGRCLKKDGEHYSTSRLYQVIRKAGVRIKDYRDGKTGIAKDATMRAEGAKLKKLKLVG